MGYEDLGLNCNENAFTMTQMSYKDGVWAHGLSAEDQKKVEKYYNRSFSKAEDSPFWASKVFKVPHTNDMIDPNSPEDILKLGVLTATGLLAPNTSEQDNPHRSYRFVLVNPGKDEEKEATLYQRRFKAAGYLDQIKSEEERYLVYLSKYLLNNQSGVMSTPQTAFVKLAKYIQGELEGSNKNDAVDLFLASLDPKYGGTKSKDELYLEVDVNDAIKRQIIRMDRNRQVFYNPMIPDSDYGRNITEVVNFLSNPKNMDHLGTGSDSDSVYAIRYQLAKANF